MLTKTELKRIFSEYGFSPLKRFGENYLIDKNIKDKIIGGAGLSGSDLVLEIGPGLGALTMDLAESGREVYAVEKDRKAFRILEDLTFEKYPNLHLVNEDILKFDFTSMPNGRIKLLGNLPYYITTPVIELIVDNRDRIESALIVIQKEVAERLLARPGNEDYASISCFIEYHTEAEYIHTIKRTAFFPEPEVDSALLRLTIRKAPPVHVRDEELLFKIIRGSFNQRRKSIINSDRKSVV